MVDRSKSLSRDAPGGLGSRTAHLRRLAIVFSVELRLKIVTELYMREMSPTQFHKEFGGGTISRVTRNFERLVEGGWLEFVRSEGPGGSRRGGTERFYRATELAYFDAETWTLLPYSIRAAFSWNSFRQIAWRLRAAIQAGRLDAPSARRLDFVALRLDRRGWTNVIDATRTHFDLLFEEQEDSARRIARSGEEAIRASVVHVAFEAPLGGAIAPPVVENTREPAVPLPVRLSKVFADPMCMRIVAEANRGEISASKFHAKLGGDAAAIRRRFKKLADVSLLKEVKTRTGGKRRGATEKFYRATVPAVFDEANSPWADVPGELAETETWRKFEKVSDLVKEAMKAGTFDARDDGCLAWSLVQLDAEGWRRVLDALDELHRLILEEQRCAKARMGKSGESPIAMTVALAGFESPKESEREP